MRRLYMLLLTALTLITVLPFMGRASAAADRPAVTVGSAEGTTGSTVRVSVSLSDNPGISAFRFRLQYDTDLLELVDVEFPENFSSPATGGNPSANPYIMTWFSTLSENESANGDFAILTFRIREGVKSGTTPLHISYDQVDVCDKDLRDVTLATVDGLITMTCEHQWDALELRCDKCGERRLSGYIQTRISDDPTKQDYRFLIEASGEVFRSVDAVILTIDFLDADGKSLRGEPFSLSITTVYEKVWAGNDFYTPKEPGNYLGGVIVSDIPLSAGIKKITLSTTFIKDGGDMEITYLLGTAELP